MSGLLTPEPVPGVGSLPVLFGLHVVLGHQDKRGRWVREPSATYTCRHGCAHTAAGALDVARFTEAIDLYHARHCPGRDRKGRTA